MTSAATLVVLSILCLSGVSSDFPKKFTLNTGYDIPAIGLGTGRTRGDLVKVVINKALSAGYRLFDSARVYKNEADLGEAFAELLPKHNLTRNDIFIVTKFDPSIEYKTEADYERIVREALEKLKTSYIDLLLLHWPGVEGLPATSPEVITYRHEAWRALIKFQKAGLLRSIGVSNFVVKHLEDLKNNFDVIPALNQIEWHPKNFNLTTLDYCRENGILVQAYSPLGTWFSTSLRNDPIVAEIAKELGKSPAQVLLRWSNQRNIAVIPKSYSKEHLEENLQLDFDIPEDKMTILDTQIERERYDPEDPNEVI